MKRREGEGKEKEEMQEKDDGKEEMQEQDDGKEEEG